MTCQGCKVALFAVRAIFQNKFVTDMAKTIIADKICPLIVLNATICENGIDTMANPLIDAMT
jgi:hypothetical protein